ncbi:succinyl-CoA--3-ketoacid-CoA transferase, partial [Pantoea sp. SIMBA_133]
TVIMDHVNKDGAPKIVKSCSLPLTGKSVVNRIITDRAVLDVIDSGLVVQEIASGYTLEDIKQSTEPVIKVSPTLKYNAY